MSIFKKKSLRSFRSALFLRKYDYNSCISRLYFAAYQKCLEFLDIYETKKDDEIPDEIRTQITKSKSNRQGKNSHILRIKLLKKIFFCKMGPGTAGCYYGYITTLHGYRGTADYGNIEISKNDIKNALITYNQLQILYSTL
jgi:hypothetical protein